VIDPVFAIAGASSVACGVMMVTRRNPVYSAVWLLGCFLSVAVLFLALSAPFLAAVHVLVYTGAILVLFLFVIMLLNLRDEEFGQEYPVYVRLSVAGLCLAMFGFLAVPILRDESLRIPVTSPSPTYGSVEEVGMLLFTTYGLPFELVSLLIVVAMFGAMILAKKKLWT
jgi:NADH-quinone oxidoreductase subunit J